MKRTAVAWLAAGLVAMAVSGAGADDAKGPLRKPKAFPEVAVTKGVPVQYGAVALDTWTGKVAYLLVEGTPSNGYSRVFAWIPGDTRFGRPVEWKAKASEGNPNVFVFGDLENKAAEEDERVSILWRFSTLKESRGAGSDSHFDYVTGKTVTRTWNASTWHRFRFAFNLGYAFGNMPSGSMDGSLPLELTMSDDLPLYLKWEQVPEPGAAPFRAVIRGKHEMQETRDPKKGRLLCQFDGFDGATIRKTPPEVSVGLRVIPYMGDAVYSNSVSVADFVKGGFDIDIPYGWYTLRLDGFRYGRFVFGAGFHRINIDPIPLSKPGS